MIPQGTLNRLRGSIKFSAHPELNVTSPYLGQEGVSIAFEGDVTTNIQNMSGTTTSPEPYVMVRATVNILKTNGLAAAFQSQMVNSTVIGDFVFTPDTSAMGTFYINNGSISSLSDFSGNGTSATWPLVLTGYYIINNSLWNLV
jgi:hypothetical protein